jgi:hypothetical protein
MGARFGQKRGGIGLKMEGKATTLINITFEYRSTY